MNKKDRWERVEHVFTDALEAGAERAEILARECAGDPELETEVTSLLEAYDMQGPADLFDRELGALRAEPSSGQRVGRYKIIDRLGAGGMAAVYRAHDERLERTVAIKLLPRVLSVDPAATRRFLLEAQSVAALDHPNICTVHEVAESDDGQLYIVMAFYQGETLKERIARQPLPVADALKVAREVARGLVHAHSHGIVHRDIKPANLLVSEGGPVKILDFGIAKVEDVNLTLSGMIVGTVPYISPEQAGGGGGVDHRTDLWSLGVVLYEMISGQRPFEAPDAEATIAAILTEDAPPLTGSPGVGAASRVLAGLLAKDVGERLPTASAAIAAIERALEALPDGTPWDGADGAAPIPAEGERRQVAVLVTRVREHADFTHQVTPDERVRAIARLREAADDIATRHGGLLHRFENDELVCLFGVPETHEDDVARCMTAAQELHAGYAGGTDDLGDPLPLRSGVCAGVLVVRPDAANRAYQVSGEPLDVASRLADQATTGEILVAPECRRQLARFFEPAPIDLTPFAGRRRELAMLREALERAAAGEGAFVTVQGEAGAGKSRLLYELDRTLAPGDFQVVRARCHAPGAGGAPYLPFIEVLRGVFDLGSAPAQTLDPGTIEANLATTAPVLAESLPLFLHLLGVHAPEFPLARHLEGEQLRIAIRDALAALCTEATHNRAMVFQFEDWHWADQASHDVLLRLAELVSAYRVTVVVTYRSGHTVTWPDAVSRTTVNLGPLDSDAAEDLVRDVLGARSVSRQVATALCERAGGNPFFLEELCNSLREQGALAAPQGEAILEGSLDQLRLPMTIQGVIRTRLDRLEQNTRELLRMASVAGREFTPSLLRSLDDSDVAVEPSLEKLKALGLIQQTRVLPEPSYRFKHILTQEVVYDTLLAHRRRALHARVGEALEVLQADRLDELADELANHFNRAQAWQKAIRYGREAARRAQELSEFSRALNLLDQVEQWALELDDETEHRATLVEVLLQQERLCETLGLRTRQQEILDRLLEMLEPVGDRATLAEVYIRQGDHHTLVKRFADAERVLRRAAALHQNLGNGGGERTALTSLGLLFWHQGRSDEGLAFIEGALAIDRLHGADVDIAGDLANLGSLLRSLRQWDRALDALEEALTLSEQADDLAMQAVVIYNIGLTHRAMGNADRALEYMKRCLALNRAHGKFFASPFAMIGIAHALLDRGDVDEAIETYRQAVAEAREVRNAEGLAQGLKILGEVLTGLGRGDEAIPCLREAAQLFAQLENRGEEARLWAQLGNLEGERGEHCASADAWTVARERRRDFGDHAGELEAAGQRARALRDAGGDSDETRAAFQDALSVAGRLEDREKEGELLNGLGILEWKVREYEAALACYERARNIFDALDDRPQAGLARNSIGATLLCLGRLDEAKRHLEEAVSANRQSGQHLLEGHALGVLGDAHLAAGDEGEAARSYQSSLVIRRQIGDRRGEGWMLHNLARVADARGESETATAYREDARQIAVERDDAELLNACERAGAPSTDARSSEGEHHA